MGLRLVYLSFHLFALCACLFLFSPLAEPVCCCLTWPWAPVRCAPAAARLHTDIVGQLSAKGAKSTSDFEWQMQLRYYWENDDLVVRQVSVD